MSDAAAGQDGVELGLFASRVAAICDEMGALLGRAAFSPNIRDRLDYSCALFDAEGRLLGQATHMPVHLGSMAYAMASVVSGRDWAQGDLLVLNDPYRGGTHLPDVTLVAPVFVGATLVGFSANRAHHVDIGADAPGSMPLSRSLEEEGLVISPRLLARAGVADEAALAAILGRLSDPATSRGDFSAQAAACRRGVARFAELAARDGVQAHFGRARRLQDYAGRLARASLRELPEGRHVFEDVLDGDGLGTEDIVIRAAIEARDGHVTVDFAGTSPQVRGNLNCPLPVTAAAVFYVVRCLMPDHLPPCDGAMRSVRITAPEGSVVNARPPAAVAAGNVETSTRIVDVLTGALAGALPGRVPAASQGTMNNLAFGRRGQGGWDYYETLAGGCGAGPDCDGRSARHTHMTNTLNTPVEVLERHYPMRVEAYALRRGSGGAGRWRGGDGVVRRYRFLDDAQVTLLTERRRHAPWGLAGGEPGQAGENRLDGEPLDGKCSLRVRAGQVLEIRTPGGGGYGEVAPEAGPSANEAGLRAPSGSSSG